MVWGLTIFILALSAASMNEPNWGLSAPPGSPNAPRYSPPRSCHAISGRGLVPRHKWPIIR